MSYLNSPRLTFSGQFQADPSTVNNDPLHFDNATFQPSYQDPQSGNNANGWWNPDGTGAWRFAGCTIQSVTYKDGTSTSDPTVDAIIGQSIMDSDTQVAGKIVDLDSQQQMVSMLWGVVVRIVADGSDVMKGDYEPAAFTNIFGRVPGMQGAGGASASYQSVIKNIIWDLGAMKSRYLKELNETSPDQLSIRFTVDMYSPDSTNAQFTLGRITGVIGPYFSGEPKHFVLGRQLMPADPACNFATAIVDENVNALVLDLANSLQFNADGSLAETRQFTIAINQGSATAPDLVNIGNIDYSGASWYMGDAGICTFPLSGDDVTLLKKFPLVVVTPHANLKNALAPQTVSPIFLEQENYVCADQFVYRFNPGEEKTVDFYTTNLGALKSDKTIVLQNNPHFFDSPPPTPPAPPDPPTGIPDILTFPASVTTDPPGTKSVNIVAGDPLNQRGYIDGQVYAVSYTLTDNPPSSDNPNNFLSILVWDSVPAATIQNPTWADIQPIMQQYANLYPLMSKGIFNLADQTVVDNNAEILKFVFSKDPNDPNYMPATRDLSAGKQQMIINYLDSVLAAAGTKETITTRKL